MSFAARLKEIVSALRGVRFPTPPKVKSTDVGGTTGEEALFRSWVREADRRGPPPPSPTEGEPEGQEPGRS